MLRYVIRRFLMGIPVLLGVSVVVFILTQVAPGDPIRLMVGQAADPETIANIREKWGLDKDPLTQYFIFVRDAIKLDFGVSFRNGQPVLDLILERIPATAYLGIAAILISIAISIPLGVLSAVHQNTIVDNTSMGLAIVGISAPVYFTALLLQWFFGLHLGWFPVSGIGDVRPWEATNIGELVESLRYLVLPAIVLGYPNAAMITRLTRSSMLEVIRQDYIMVARAKGLRERTVIYRHALRNALIPVVTIVGLQFTLLVGGAVVTETIFNWPGMGRMIIDALISNRDYAMIRAITLIIAATVVFLNIVVDVLYALIDPRIQYS
ncbi:MAG: ABC transporter permease [Methanobacteriota archaeon]|nr:MAG: ABC transporter permease [Euryarchaeota archaeon]